MDSRFRGNDASQEVFLVLQPLLLLHDTAH